MLKIVRFKLVWFLFIPLILSGFLFLYWKPLESFSYQLLYGPKPTIKNITTIKQLKQILKTNRTAMIIYHVDWSFYPAILQKSILESSEVSEYCIRNRCQMYRIDLTGDYPWINEVVATLKEVPSGDANQVDAPLIGSGEVYFLKDGKWYFFGSVLSDKELMKNLKSIK